MKDREKWLEYAVLISGAINEMLTEEDSPYYIDFEELEEGDNSDQFFFALSTVVPTRIYNNGTGKGLNNLEYNHFSNYLCFKYCKLDNEETETTQKP